MITAGKQVSIIVPVLGDALLLEASLQSLLDQTTPDVEVVIVETGSPQQRHPVVADALRLGAEAPWRLTVLDAPARTVAEAFNAGAGAASGELLMFLNPEDGYFPQRVSTFVRGWQLSLAPELFWGFSGVAFADAAGNLVASAAVGKPVEGVYSAHVRLGVWVPHLLLRHNLIQRAGNMVVTRELFSRTAGFPNYAVGSEWGLGLELNLWAQPFVPPVDLYVWRVADPRCPSTQPAASPAHATLVRSRYEEQLRTHLAGESVLRAGLPGLDRQRLLHDLAATQSG